VDCTYSLCYSTVPYIWGKKDNKESKPLTFRKSLRCTFHFQRQLYQSFVVLSFLTTYLQDQMEGVKITGLGHVKG